MADDPCPIGNGGLYFPADYALTRVTEFPREPRTMTTPIQSVAFFVLASLLGAVGQFLYKSGADQTTSEISSYLFNARILGGVACYGAVMVLFVAAFKKGGSLSVLYPIYATTFIWAALIGWAAYETPIRLVNVAGMALLIGGMYL
ncbi:MAG: hypothetical protein N2C14_22485, partial [Planctomycetales bacterium]